MIFWGNLGNFWDFWDFFPKRCTVFFPSYLPPRLSALVFVSCNAIPDTMYLFYHDNNIVYSVISFFWLLGFLLDPLIYINQSQELKTIFMMTLKKAWRNLCSLRSMKWTFLKRGMAKRVRSFLLSGPDSKRRTDIFLRPFSSTNSYADEKTHFLPENMSGTAMDVDRMKCCEEDDILMLPPEENECWSHRSILSSGSLVLRDKTVLSSGSLVLRDKPVLSSGSLVLRDKTVGGLQERERSLSLQ